jgi:hypothetical protein
MFGRSDKVSFFIEAALATLMFILLVVTWDFIPSEGVRLFAIIVLFQMLVNAALSWYGWFRQEHAGSKTEEPR